MLQLEIVGIGNDVLLIRDVREWVLNSSLGLLHGSCW